MQKTYIHYGHDASEFDPKLIANASCCAVLSKPDKGLWASPIDSDWGWKDWCELEEWSCSDMSKSFIFTLTSTAEILEIHREEDILPYLIREQDEFLLRRRITNPCEKLNRELLYKKFDGIELFISENWSMHDGVFCTWDCDSICVWNPEVIELVR